jgi:hypothetical protein
VIEWGRQDPTVWDFADGAQPEAYLDLSEWRPSTMMREAEQVLPWTVLPGYALALGARLAHERELEGIAALHCLRIEVIDHLEYLPAAGVLACFLLFAGKKRLRLRLHQELFKHQHERLRRDAMSAAWDLGLLQLLVLWGVGSANTPLGGRRAIVVSEDRGLNLLAPMVTKGAAVGGAILDAEHLEPELARQASALFMEILVGRGGVAGAPAVPTWDGNVAVAQRVERELGMVDAPSLTVTGGRISIDVSGADVLRWLDALASESSTQAAESIVGARLDGQDLNPAALLCVGRLVHDKAAVRKRDVKGSWQMVAERLPESPAENVIVGSVFHLARAVAVEDWSLASIWIGKIAAHGGAELSEIILWSIGRTVLEDTAEAHGESAAKLIARIRTRLLEADTSDTSDQRP